MLINFHRWLKIAQIFGKHFWLYPCILKNALLHMKVTLHNLRHIYFTKYVVIQTTHKQHRCLIADIQSHIKSRTFATGIIYLRHLYEY